MFIANQIGNLLDIKKISTSIKDFDETEKLASHTMGASYHG